MQAANLKHVEPELTEPQVSHACAQSETAVKQVESVSSMSKLQVSKPLCHVNISARSALATVHGMHFHTFSHEVLKI